MSAQSIRYFTHTAKANITKEDYIDTVNFTPEIRLPRSVAKFHFNKPLNDNGGTKGKLKIFEKSDDVAMIKVKQDLNGDGKFTNDELIYQGKQKNVEDMDALINFEGEIKLKKYMSKCEWKHLKNPDKPIDCTEEFDPGYTTLRFWWYDAHSDQGNDLLMHPPIFYPPLLLSE